MQALLLLTPRMSGARAHRLQQRRCPIRRRAKAPIQSLPALFRPAACGAAAREPLTLEVGHSTALRTQQRLRRVYVSNPEVIDCITASPHDLILTAKTGGSSSLAIWTEDGVTSFYDVLAGVDLAEPAKALRLAFPYERSCSRESGRTAVAHRRCQLANGR